jgi:hypothetical protein
VSMIDSRDLDEDLFVVLGVSCNCKPSEVKRAYRLLARQFHPDLNPDPLAAERMSRINRAYARALRQAERNARLSSRLRADPTVRQGGDGNWAPDSTAPARAAPVASGGASAARRDAAPAVNGLQQPPEAATLRHAPLRMHIRARRGTLAPLPCARAPRARSLARKGAGRGTAIVASLLLATLLAVFFARILDIFPAAATRSRTSHTSMAAEIRLGNTSYARWTDGRFLSLRERLLVQLASDMTLNEPPQWSRNTGYVAISMTPQRSSASMNSVTYLLHGSRVVATLPATSGRWSPTTNQLAIVTNPTTSRPPQLEIVSPAAIDTPRILDRHASTHLAWSGDGTRIAYSADGQQQLRMVSVQRGSHVILVEARGQRLIPIGWRNGQIMQIVHEIGAEALVGVESVSGQVTLLAPLGSSTPESTVAVGHEAVTYVAKEAGIPFVTIHLASSTQKWHAELPGIRSVRLLAAWSADGTWVAIAPMKSAMHMTQVCLAHLERAGTPPPSQWNVQCLQVPGVLVGMSWELQSNTLSYVRTAPPSGKLELRELSLDWQATAMLHSPNARVHRPPLSTPGPLTLTANLDVPRECAALWCRVVVSGRCGSAQLLFIGDP